MPPKNRKKQTKEQILDVAVRLFLTKGFEKTHYSELAETTGITKAGVYYHFPNKEDLYLKVVDKVMTGSEEWVENLLKSEMPVQDKLRTAVLDIDNFSEFIDSQTGRDKSLHYYINNIVLYGIDKYPEVQKRVALYYDNMRVQIEAILHEAQSREELIPGTDLSGAAMLIISTIEGLTLLNPIKLELDNKEYSRKMYDVLAKGIFKS
jgi:AcrR family transcriptional regulator